MLTPIQLILLIAVALALYWAWRAWQQYQLNQRINTPLPPACLELLAQQLPIYQKLDENLQQKLQQNMQRFLATKQFIGCEGLVVTDEMRWLIASQACLLVVNHTNTGYQNLRWIYIYPAQFFTERSQRDAAGVVEQLKLTLLGESWHNGKVILSWHDVAQGIKHFDDGHNVALHEFAHQLDAESGTSNGAPLLENKTDYISWARVLSQDFALLQRKTKHHQADVIDQYGATNPAEFFAVATECFFEKPEQLNQQHPYLFEQLQHYYHLDPRQWQ